MSLLYEFVVEIIYEITAEAEAVCVANAISFGAQEKWTSWC